MVKIFRTKKRLKLEEKVNFLENKFTSLESLIDALSEQVRSQGKKIEEMQLILDNLTDENTTSKTAQQLLNEYFYGEQK